MLDPDFVIHPSDVKVYLNKEEPIAPETSEVVETPEQISPITENSDPFKQFLQTFAENVKKAKELQAVALEPLSTSPVEESREVQETEPINDPLVKFLTTLTEVVKNDEKIENFQHAKEITTEIVNKIKEETTEEVLAARKRKNTYIPKKFLKKTSKESEQTPKLEKSIEVQKEELFTPIETESTPVVETIEDVASTPLEQPTEETKESNPYVQQLQSLDKNTKTSKKITQPGDIKSLIEKSVREQVNQFKEEIMMKVSHFGEGGGGTVAVQYAGGGTMNGTLNVVGQILSAGRDISNYFGNGGGPAVTDRLTAGYDELVLNPDGSVTFPDNVIRPIEDNIITLESENTALSAFTRVAVSPYAFFAYDSNSNSITFDSVDNSIVLTSQDNYEWTFNDKGQLIGPNGVLTVNGTLSTVGKILSGGKDLFDIFLTSSTDSQTLSYEASSYKLSISNGNFVSLSSLASSPGDESVNTLVHSNSANWNAAYTNLVSNSAAYLSGYDLSFLSVSGNWNSTYTTVGSNSSNWDSAYNISTAYQDTSGSFATNTLLQSTSALLTPLTLTSDLTSQLVLNTDFNNYQTSVAASTATLLPTSVYQNTSGSFIQTVNGTTNQINASTVGSTVTLSLPSSAIFPGDVSITGNLTVAGSAAYINVQNFVVGDNLIYLNNNNYGSNVLDTGFVSHFTQAPLGYNHTGLVRKAGQGTPGIWTLFSGLTTEPASASNIDWSDPNLVVDSLSANLIGNVTGNADTVTNGVYTTGSYSDPSWITSLADTKITGTKFATNTTLNTVSSQLLPTSVYQSTSGTFVTNTAINTLTGNWNTAYQSVSSQPYTLINSTSSIQPIRGNNTASAIYSVILGGLSNTISASACNSIIGGGCFNVISTIGVLSGSNLRDTLVLAGSGNCVINNAVNATGSVRGPGIGTTSSCNNAILGGIGNKICTTGSGYYGNAIYACGTSISNTNAILGGFNNKICTTGTGSAYYNGASYYPVNNTSVTCLNTIVGGCNNTINSCNTNVCNNFILGSNITVNSGCNTTYVNNLNASGAINGSTLSNSTVNSSTVCSSTFNSATIISSIVQTSTIVGSTLYGTSNLANTNTSSVVGGTSNNAAGVCAFVGGGSTNISCGTASLIVGGLSNCVCTNASASSIVGGSNNRAACGTRIFIGGGCSNIIGAANVIANYSFIGAGACNLVTGPYSTVVGGFSGCATGYATFVGAGSGVCATGPYAVAVGGQNNTASGCYNFVGGGLCNTACFGASFGHNTVVGGRCNTAGYAWDFVGGGNANTAGGSCSVVAGGNSNIVIGLFGGILAGYGNAVYGCGATIVGGQGNKACGAFSNILGGCFNCTCGNYSIINGGRLNCLTASGAYSIIGGGLGNYNPLRDSQIVGGVANHTGGYAPFNITAAASISGNGTQTCLIGTSIQNCFSSPFTSNNVSVYYSTPTVPLSAGCFTTATVAATGTNYVIINGDYSTCTASGLSATSIYVYDRAINNTGYDNFIGGGKLNTASGCYASVVGGKLNTASGYGSFVGGGISNKATGCRAIIVGGASLGNGHTASGLASIVVGGNSPNTASGNYSIIIGGYGNNQATGSASLILGGQQNTASATNGTVINGVFNGACGTRSTVSGYANVTFGSHSIILNGNCNRITASGAYSSIVNGRFNYNPLFNSSIEGGSFNHTGGYAPANITLGANLSGNGACTTLITSGIGSCFSASNTTGAVTLVWMTSGTANQSLSSACFTIANIVTNAANCIIINGDYSTCTTSGLSACNIYVYDRCLNQGGCFNFIGGGVLNTNSGCYSTIGGGLCNTNLSTYGTIAGGWRTTINANSNWSFIGGGAVNTASGTYTVVVGGNVNTACSGGAVVGGQGNLACGKSFVGNGFINTASGAYSAIAGGRCACAGGAYSTAGGRANTASGVYSIAVGGNYNFNPLRSSVIGGGMGNHTGGYTPLLVTSAGLSGNGTCTVINLGGAYGSCFSNTGTAAAIGLLYTTTTNPLSNACYMYNANLVCKTLDNTCLIINPPAPNNDISTCAPNSLSALSVYVIDRCINQTAYETVIGGGVLNTVSGCYSSVLGGFLNTVSGNRSSIIGGSTNTASGAYSFVAGGSANDTKGFSNTFILGTALSASRANYTYVNNLSVQGNIASNTAYTATAYLSANTTAPTNADLWLPLSVRNDPNNWITNTGTYPALSGVITPTIPGYYFVNYQIAWNGTTGTGQNNAQIRLNGTTTKSLVQMPLFTGSGGAQTQTATAIVYLNGVSDSLNFSAYSSGTGQTVVGTTDGNWTKVEVYKIN